MDFGLHGLDLGLGVPSKVSHRLVGVPEELPFAK